MTSDSKTDAVAELRAMLAEHVFEDTWRDYGFADAAALESVVDAWLDDAHNSAPRYDELFALAGEPQPDARILDMASGCGTFVFHGLLRGFDVWGLDCADWKLEFNHRKVDAYDYPQAWKDRFLTGVGEALPFPDDHFDLVSSFQTLEHVQDVGTCLSELLRVTRPGGGIHIQCPDYRGSFEPHYRLPWLPLMPRRLAAYYLRCCGRPTRGIDAIHYVTQRGLLRALAELEATQPDCRLDVVPVRRRQFSATLARHGLAELPGMYGLEAARQALRRLFRADTQVDLFVRLQPR